MIHKIYIIFKLLRLPTVIFMNLFMFIPLYIQTGKLRYAVIGTIPFIFLIMGEIILNDLCGIKSDEKSKPHRPLAAKEISKATAIILMFLLLVLAIISSLYAFSDSLLRLLLFFGIMVLLSIYNIPLGFFASVKTFFTAILVSLCLLFPYTYDVITGQTILFLIASFFFITGRETLMDIRDCIGDEEQGYNTIAILFGENIAFKLAVISFLISLSFCLVLTIVMFTWLKLMFCFIIILSVLILIWLFRRNIELRNKICLLLWIPMLLILPIIL